MRLSLNSVESSVGKVLLEFSGCLVKGLMGFWVSDLILTLLSPRPPSFRPQRGLGFRV